MNGPSTNALFHEWGLLSTLLGMLIPLLGLLWWLLQERNDEGLKAALRIRSQLANLFQFAVLDATQDFMGSVFESLALALAGADPHRPRPTPFRNLVNQLNKEVPGGEEEERESSFQRLIERELIELLKTEVQRQLSAALTGLKSAEGSRLPAYTPRLSFEGETERRLTLLARRTVQTNRQEKQLFDSKKHAIRALLAAISSGLVASPWVFVNARWAFHVLVVLLTAGLFSTLLALWSIYRRHRAESWLKENADLRHSVEDWFDEFDSR